MRLRLILPAIHVAVAFTLFVLGAQQLETPTGRRLYGNFGPPATRLAYAINAPVFILRSGTAAVWDKLDPHRGLLPAEFDKGLFIIVVALLWYYAGTEIELRIRGRRGIRASRPIQVATRIIFVIFGLLSGIVGIGVWIGKDSQFLSTGQALLEASLYLTWAAVLVTFYSRDMVRSLFPKAMPNALTE